MVNGTAAGGGYELALATDHIILADDGSAAVALPEVPLLAVLPGTGGLTRVTDKRKVRRDHADVFCTIEEGIKGKRAVALAAGRRDRAEHQARRPRSPSARRNSPPASKRNGTGKGIALTPLERKHRREQRALRFCQCRYRPRRAHRDHHDSRRRRPRRPPTSTA